MSEVIEKNKKARKVTRASVTKLIKELEPALNEKEIDVEYLEETINTLNLKAVELKTLDDIIVDNMKVDAPDFESEIESAQKYQHQVSLWTFRIQRKLKSLKKDEISTVVNRINESIHHDCPNDHKLVRLPKLTISKFYGDCSQWMNFWNSFKVAIHENEHLSNIEKFNYLKSYLGGQATASIDGFLISESNYDSVVSLLENIFGRKDLIINCHMKKLLNLTPVQRSSDISKLRKLHDSIETQVRSLEALEVKSDTYSNLLIPILMKYIPNDLALEFSRKNNDSASCFDVKKFLEFIQNELESRERASLLTGSSNNPKFQESSCSMGSRTFGNSPSIRGVKNKEFSAHELVASVRESKGGKNCVFCKAEHSSEFCEALSVDEKRNLLRQQGRCFLCLGNGHRIKECKAGNQTCSYCKGNHNRALCFKHENNLKEQSQNKDKKDQIDSQVLSAVSHNKGNSVLLQTCTAVIKNNNKSKTVRLLLDNGSMRTFIKKEISDKLQLKVIKTETLSVFTFGTKSPIEKSYDIVKVKLENRKDPDANLEIEALVTENISGSDIPPPRFDSSNVMKQMKDFMISDSYNCNEPISLLIGADYYYNVVTGKLKRLNKNLVAVESIFGWCFQGRGEGSQNTSVALNVIVGESVISDQIRKFWELEQLGINDAVQSLDPLDNEVLKQFESDIKYENNRYKVRLPWKENSEHLLHDNKEIARQRFERLKIRFRRNPDLFISYQSVINDYLSQNIIEVVPDDDANKQVIFYLPHREVLREDRVSSKIRIVFDASSHGPDKLSLNDCLHIGPNLYPDIFDILLNFRKHSIAYTNDIRQAFLQVVLDERDRDVCRFFFTDDPNNDSVMPLIYRFTRVLFGINSSPFLLAATIKHHLKRYNEIFPETVRFLNENVYVDDVIGSFETVEKAFTTSLECSRIFKDAGMTLHKHCTNSEELHKLWEKEKISSDNGQAIFSEKTVPFKVLGMAWENSKDLLYFEIDNLLSFIARKIDSKRFVLQVIGRIFDPLGMLGPFTLRAKCLMQEIWKLQIDWDDILPENLKLIWHNWCLEIPHLKEFSIHRYCFSELGDSNIENIELHCFSDASMKGYGAVAYLRASSKTGQIHTTFIASKNRVTPLKSLTLPRLELLGALLSAKLGNRILKSLKLNIPCYFWTDSQITYFWIKGSPLRFKLFVRNRIEEIQKLTSPEDWHHCPGKTNPADLVSRGASVKDLIENPVWVYGPDWLRQESEFLPSLKNDEGIEEEHLEYQKKFRSTYQLQCISEDSRDLIDIDRYSDIERLLRVTSWMMRFISKLKKQSDECGTLSAEELSAAETYWIKVEQRKVFNKEITDLTKTSSVKKDSHLYKFAPFLDQDGILRIGGRLEYSDLSTDEKHPKILPKNSRLTVLIIDREHQKTMHSGTAATLAKIRSRFWIPKGRQIVKSGIKKCMICQKYLARPSDQISSQLPEDRIHETSPFSVSGIDFAGPIYVKNFDETAKSYIALFTCAVTRAVHLELVSNMSTDSFLLAFRRFTARRGNCKIIYSDNAKTFKKSKKEIEGFSEVLSDDIFRKFIAKERIIWKNIVERAAWWGGFYERLVKSVKDCLRKILGRALLTFEEMSTVLVEVENVLNMRPLTFVYNDNEEPEPLTPMHFLNFGRNEQTYPINFASIIGEGSNRNSLLKRKQYQTLLVKQLWCKWKTQYLLDLRTAHELKSPNSHPDLKEGDIVLVEGDSKSKLLWKLGKIVKTFPGRDDRIRSCEVKTSNGTLKRSVQHLYKLEH